MYQGVTQEISTIGGVALNILLGGLLLAGVFLWIVVSNEDSETEAARRHNQRVEASVRWLVFIGFLIASLYLMGRGLLPVSIVIVAITLWWNIRLELNNRSK